MAEVCLGYDVKYGQYEVKPLNVSGRRRGEFDDAGPGHMC